MPPSTCESGASLQARTACSKSAGGQRLSAQVSRGGSAQPDLRSLLNPPLTIRFELQDVVLLPNRRPRTRSTNGPSDHRLVTPWRERLRPAGSRSAITPGHSFCEKRCRKRFVTRAGPRRAAELEAEGGGVAGGPAVRTPGPSYGVVCVPANPHEMV